MSPQILMWSKDGAFSAVNGSRVCDTGIDSWCNDIYFISWISWWKLYWIALNFDSYHIWNIESQIFLLWDLNFFFRLYINRYFCSKIAMCYFVCYCSGKKLSLIHRGLRPLFEFSWLSLFVPSDQCPHSPLQELKMT